MSLCEYKDIFGIPNEGVHSYRLFNIAIIDVICTIIGAYFLSYLFRWNFTYTLIGLFLLGIIFHRIFCVRTTVDKLLFFE
jgi:hypothetical protein